MQGRRQKAAVTGAAAIVLASSAALAAPGTASADTKEVPCGSTVTAKPGDQIIATGEGLLGLVRLDLGVVQEGTTVLSGTVEGLLAPVCEVTVQVLKEVPVVGDPAADVVQQGTKTLNDAAQQLAPGQPAPNRPPPQESGPQGNQESGPSQQTGGQPPQQAGNQPSLLAPRSPGVGGGFPLRAALPADFSTGWSPMRSYSDLPFATAGLFAPSPGVRYGSQIPGYAPGFDVLGSERQQTKAPDPSVRKAGDAQALPDRQGPRTDPTGLPVLLAVLALSGATAALVRTWVLRRARLN